MNQISKIGLKPAYIYSRFSSQEQSKGHSLERQIQQGRAFVEQQGWQLVSEITDEGKSAFDGANRADGSALYEFEKQALAGKFHNGAVLVVENIDRLSRQGAKAAARLIWMLNENGVDVATWHDQHIYKSGSEAEMMDSFSVIVKAQLAFDESMKKSRRISAAWTKRHEKIASGDKPKASRLAPHWMTVDNGQHVLVPDRVEVINWIFDSYIAGQSVDSIARKLNARKEPVWGRGDGWYSSYISKILVNRRLIGEYVLHPKNDVSKRGTVIQTDYYPKAITAEKFNRAQAARISRRKSGGRQQSVAPNIFSGVAKCAECGGTMGFINKGVDKRKPHLGRSAYLQCNANRRKHSCHNSIWVRYERLKEGVLKHIHEWVMADSSQQEPSAVRKLREDMAENARLIEAKSSQLATLTNNLMEVFSKALAQKAAELENDIEAHKTKHDQLSTELAIALSSTRVDW